MPIVATYLRALRKGLDGAGIPARAAADAVERRADHRHGGRRAADEHHRVRPGRRRGRRAGAGARQGARRRSSPSTWAARPPRPRWSRTARSTRAHGIRGRRRHHDRLAAADRRRLHAEGAGDRPRRGRRRRRLACLDRCAAARCRSGRRAPAPRRARSATTRAATSRPSPTPTSCSATSIPAHLVGGALKLNADEGARGVRRARSPSRSA